MTTETSADLPHQYTAGEVLRQAPVRRLLIATFVLSIGSALQAAALGKQVFDITGRESDLGWIGLAEFLPLALLVLVTGTVADRVNRKLVALAAVGVELVATISLLLYSLSGPTAVWPFFGIAFLYGIGRAFQAPVVRAMPPMVAPEGGLPRVIALFTVSWTAAAIIGPAMSGFLYAIDPAVPYMATTGLIFAGMLLLTLVTFVREPAKPDPEDRPTLRHAVEGLRFIRRTPILLAAISLDLFAVLFGGAIALLPAIADERLHVGDVAYGWLRAAAGVGAAAMGALLAIRPLRRHVGRNLFVCVGIFGAATVVLGLTTNYFVAIAAVLILSAADMVSVFIRGTLVPLVTPDEKRGRVLAVESVFIGASNELGAFESGLVASAAGTPATVVGGGVATLAVVAIWSQAFPALRNIDRFEELGEPGGSPADADVHGTMTGSGTTRSPDGTGGVNA